MFKTTAKIDGMMCGMCEAHINDCIRNSFDIKKVTSSSKKGEAIITSETKIDEEKLKKVIEQTGYQIKAIHVEQADEKCGISKLFKKKA